MTGIWIVSFVFLCGLVAGGLLGVVLEIWAGRRLAFAEPFVSRRFPVRSLATTAISGPFMLVNETLEAFRQRSVGPVTLAGSIALALTWVFLTGIVVADLAIFVGHLVA